MGMRGLGLGVECLGVQECRAFRVMRICEDLT